jgi:hypothetical protein
LPLLDGQVHHDTHAVPMGNYVIAVRNYVIVSPSELGNYKIADTRRLPVEPGRLNRRHEALESEERNSSTPKGRFTGLGCEAGFRAGNPQPLPFTALPVGSSAITIYRAPD